MPKPTKEAVAALSHEDEQRPVVAFLRAAGWPDEQIVKVVEAHKRGESYDVKLTIGGVADVDSE